MHLSLITTLLLFLCGCQQDCSRLEPNIVYVTPQRLVENLPSPFPELTSEEKSQEWARELFLGRKFARELDLYRAITCFKRAQFLLPSNLDTIPRFNVDNRRLEIEYEIFLAYYLGNKYQEAIDTFDSGGLIQVPADFPVFNELLIALYDAYIQIDEQEKALKLLCYINAKNQAIAQSLTLETAISNADFPNIKAAGDCHPAKDNIDQLLGNYKCRALSPTKARTLNALLPGAGYYYVGQQKAALTSFIINALFIAASYQLLEKGYIPAGIITASLEAGWYFGGINGAGLAAKEYNERLYECLSKETLMETRLFPVLMLNYGF